MTSEKSPSSSKIAKQETEQKRSNEIISAIGENDTEVEEAEEVVQDLLNKVPEEMLVRAMAERDNLLEALVEEEGASNFGTRIVAMAMRMSSGPIPPPHILKDYNEIDPSFAERIVSMAEKEQNHRHDLDKASLKATHDIDKRGQHFALATILSMLLVVAFLALQGFTLSAIVIAAIGAAAQIFYTKGNKTEKEKEDTKE